jgi:alkanesulfonate monooxygenase SsuD/methylene tetrahydromethanopterin reductase-like flavin-dependent oxidoreductase (luciferase family)
LVLPAQHPAVLAKRIATVDRLSNGRLIVGVGIGDSASEADALAVDRTHRAALTTESIEVMRTIWTADRGASFDGRLFTLHDIDAAPRPAQPLGPRITIGGHSVAAARRAGRLGYGLIPLGVAPDAIETLLAEARKEAEHGGWDTESIELTVSFDRDPATLHRLADIGAHRFVLDAPPSGDLDELRDAIRAARSSIADLGRATTR